MIFVEKDKKTGKTFIVCSKFWPDGARFRRRFPTKTIANQVMNRIIASIALGTWQELKKELTDGPEQDYTIKQFAEVYMEEYCEIRNTRPDFKEETLAVITDIVGDRSLKHFTKADAHYFEKERAKKVSNATVNRGLSVLSNMLTFACRKGLIPVSPMSGYGKLPVDETVRRILEPTDARLIVEKTLEVEYTVGAYVGILAETGLRMEEGLNLKRDLFNVKRRTLTVEASKNYKTRVVPLSDYALQLFSGLPVVVGNPYVFVRLSTMERLRAPRKEYEAGKRAAKVPWPGFHDLRHYRATQWLRHGVDIRTVKEWLGHKDIKTTMLYLRFVEGHAEQKFREAEKAELLELVNAGAGGEKVATK
jgi:integrase